MAQRFRNYCYTLNNYEEGEFLRLKAIECLYHVIGKEVGEQEGTPHLQGFIIFKNARSFNGVKKLIPRAHIEICKGSPKQNIEYCKKQGDFIELGEAPVGQGKRTDIVAVKEMVKNNVPLVDVLDSVTSVQAFNFAEKLYKYVGMQRDWKTEVFWYYGPTASGKSRAAFNTCPKAYWKSPNNKWWDGYDSHSEVIMDDIRPESIPFNEMLRLLDRYPMMIEFKGGSRQFLAKKIVITTTNSPRDFYKNLDGEDVNQLVRRVENILRFPL